MRGFIPGAMIPLGIAAMFGLVLLAEPDFGSTVIIFAVVLMQLLLVSNLKHLSGLAAIGKRRLRRTASDRASERRESSGYHRRISAPSGR